MIQSDHDLILMKLVNPDEFKYLTETEFGYSENIWTFEGFVEDKIPEPKEFRGTEYHSGRRFYAVYSVRSGDEPFSITGEDIDVYQLKPWVLYFCGEPEGVGTFLRFETKSELSGWLNTLSGSLDFEPKWFTFTM